MNKLKNLSNNIDPFGTRIVRKEILKAEATKKFIENQIKNLLFGSVKVLKRNPGHVSLAEVEIMPSKRLADEISKYCRERIIFKQRDEAQVFYDDYEKSREKEMVDERRKLKRKAKRKRKRILKAIYRGFAPNPTSF